MIVYILNCVEDGDYGMVVVYGLIFIVVMMFVILGFNKLIDCKGLWNVRLFEIRKYL